MRVHDLKTLRPYHEDVKAGRKDFEVRLNDRCYEVGDIVRLFPVNVHGNYVVPGEPVVRYIKYILAGGQFGIAEDYVVLGLTKELP